MEGTEKESNVGINQGDGEPGSIDITPFLASLSSKKTDVSNAAFATLA